MGWETYSGSLLAFSTIVQILILSTFFITIALLSFLILNIRPDPTETLRSRIKKLQVNLLRDWLEHHEDRMLRISDLESRREEVRKELLNGLGKMRGSHLEDADRIIDEGWSRIIEILAEKEIVTDKGTEKSTAETPSPIDMKQLEEMITRAVAEAKFIVPPEALKGLQVQAPISAARPSSGQSLHVEIVGEDDEAGFTAPGQPIEVEELEEFDDLEELDELDEVGDEVPAGPGEPVEVEELEELEDLEELDELDEVGDEVPAGPGEPVEVEELEELEDLEELDELDEVVDEVPAGPGEPVEVEELEELEDLEELDELDEVVDEVPAGPGEPVEVEELEELEELDELEELAEADEDVSTSDLALQESEQSASSDFTEFDGVPVTGKQEIASVEPSGDDFNRERENEGEIADNLEELESAGEEDGAEAAGDEEDVLEVLPVVLSDDSRELIEIDKIDQDRLYMFEKEFRNSKETRDDFEDSAELQELDEEIEEISEIDEHGIHDKTESDGTLVELDDLEELDELDEAEDHDKLKKDTASSSEVTFISIEDIIEKIRRPESVIDDMIAADSSDRISMESLIMTRTTGILPGMDLTDDEFLFDDETPYLSWSEEGLDYDRYLKGFKKGATGVYKSLMTLSKDYNAICGVLLAGSRKGLETDYAVGLDDDSATYLSVAKNEAVWDTWFNERKVIYVPQLSNSLYAEKTSHNEFRFIKAALFMPALYHGSHAYIFLSGFKDTPIDPMAMLVNIELAK